MENSSIQKVAVVGLGYVGLPLALEFYKGGLQVWGIETDNEKVKKLRAGVSYLDDVPSRQIKEALETNRFSITDAYDILEQLDAVCICVPTPLNKVQEPDLSYIVQAVDAIEPHLHKNMLVVLESTTYPGTTEEVVLPRLAKRGLRVGEDFYLSFSLSELTQETNNLI
jgi:UDP-N-acetyl-D-glucosamine dehydrogenase